MLLVDQTDHIIDGQKEVRELVEGPKTNSRFTGQDERVVKFFRQVNLKTKRVFNYSTVLRFRRKEI